MGAAAKPSTRPLRLLPPAPAQRWRGTLAVGRRSPRTFVSTLPGTFAMTSANGAARAEAHRFADDLERLARDGRRAVEAGRDALPELMRQARDLFGDRFDVARKELRDRGGEAADEAGEALENARLYVVERVHERPLTSTLAALGAGFILGLLLAGPRK